MSDEASKFAAAREALRFSPLIARVIDSVRETCNPTARDWEDKLFNELRTFLLYEDGDTMRAADMNAIHAQFQLLLKELRTSGVRKDEGDEESVLITKGNERDTRAV